MGKLNEIKKEISLLGVKRIKYELSSIDTAMGHLRSIMEEMLKSKKETLDFDIVKSHVEFMINWTYMVGDMNFNRGFLLKGSTGRGKTFLFRAWLYFLRIDAIKFYYDGAIQLINSPVVNVKAIAGEYQNPTSGGYQVIEKYGYMKCLILDDIGKEDDFSRSYGNKINVIEEIINIREDLGLLTFGTTNENDMKKLYDDRTISRMNKLFTAVPVNHKVDFRKKT